MYPVYVDTMMNMQIISCDFDHQHTRMFQGFIEPLEMGNYLLYTRAETTGQLIELQEIHLQ